MPTIERTRIPKYVALANKLTEDIEAGVLKPGDRLPSFGEMAEQFGIASNTTDRVFATLEQNGLVRREVGRGIFVAEPNKRDLTGLIGLTGVGLSRRDSHPVPGHLAEGIENITEREGFQFVLLKSVSAVGWDKVDGVFLCEPDAEASLKQLPSNLPCVSLLMPLEGLASVVADDYQGGMDATRHLTALGHRRIAYLMTHLHPLCQRRLAGYHMALRAAGIRPEPNWISEPQAHWGSSENRDRGRRSMQHWLETDWQKLGCTAFLAQNDEVAIGAIEVLQEAGIDVPQQISVVGFDGTELGDACSPRLTTVQVPFTEIGAAATKVLLEQINTGNSKPISIVLPTALREGESTAPPPR